MKKGVLWLCALLLCAVCVSAYGEDLYVQKVEDLREDFIMGMDVSSVTALENSGVTYHNFAGEDADLFDVLQEAGINYIRVRVWNDPWDADGNGYGGGNCDLANAISIGQRATAHGMRLLVDFHYSDFWADPSKQQVPKAWAELDADGKAEAIASFTTDCLTRLRDAGVDVGMVQIGNETTTGFCGETSNGKVCKLMNAAAAAIRAVDPDILIAVHYTNPEDDAALSQKAMMLRRNKVDYDVFSVSWYPYWHGTLEHLTETLAHIAEVYGKQVMVAETSYAYTEADTDFSGNTVGEGGGYEKYYPFTVQGQANEVADLIAGINSIGGLGVFYWEGAWISVGQSSWAENSALWEKYGSGWASSYAAEYDPDDAGQYYGGCACDNQAMFDANGDPLASLKVFSLVREGQEVPPAADALDEVMLTFDLAAQVVLPETVNAVMNDNSRVAIPVTWDALDEAFLSSTEPVECTVYGEAGGMQAVCTVYRVRKNYIQNSSFEDDDTSMWIATDLKKADELYVEEKKSDSKTGLRHYHFYSKAADSVEFTLEQTLTVPAGTYHYEISIQGGDGGETEIYSYVLRNGEQIATAPAVITSWSHWDTPTIDGIEVQDGDEITVGLYVRCAGEGSGAWGKIDDAVFCVGE